MFGAEFRADVLTLARDADVVRLFGGRVITRVGDSLYFVATMWLVFELTGSTFYTGLAGALARGPQAFRFLVGPLVDRMHLRYSLVLPQLLQAGIVLVIPVAAATNQLSVVIVLVVIPVLSAVGQLDDPAQNAAVPRVVDDELLVRANGLFSLFARGSKAGANAFAGVLVTAVGATAAYVFDAATFAIAALLFGTLRLQNGSAELDAQQTQPYLTALRAGWHLVQSSVILPMIVGAALGNFLISVAYAVLPAYAESLGGAATYGLLLGAISAGMLIGSILASVVEDQPFGHVTVGSFLLGACCWAGGIVLSHRVGTAVLLAAAGIAVGIYNVLVLSATQTGVPNEFLGRVMALAGTATGIATPLGFLLGGVLGDVFHITLVMLAPAVGYGAVGIYWFAYTPLRRFRPVTEIAPNQFELSSDSSTSPS